MEKAYKNSCHIAYSAVRKMDDGTFRNSTQIINPRGEIVGIYNKNHPTIGETEEDNILPGKDAKVISCDFGKVACAICFDLNFDPLWEKYKPQSPTLSYSPLGTTAPDAKLSSLPAAPISSAPLST